MSKSYIAGVGDFLPNAEITFDPEGYVRMLMVSRAMASMDSSNPELRFNQIKLYL